MSDAWHGPKNARCSRHPCTHDDDQNQPYACMGFERPQFSGPLISFVPLSFHPHELTVQDRIVQFNRSLTIDNRTLAHRPMTAIMPPMPGSSRRPLLLALLLLALAVLPQSTAYLCTEEPPAIRKKEGACLDRRESHP